MENLPPNRNPQINGYLSNPLEILPLKLPLRLSVLIFWERNSNHLGVNNFAGVSFHFSWCLINSDPYIIYLRFSKECLIFPDLSHSGLSW